MFTIYAIKSNTKNYIYVWMTNNIEKRIKEHNSGYEKTTKPYAPFTLIYTEKLATRSEARIREKYFKSWQWKDFLKWL